MLLAWAFHLVQYMNKGTSTLSTNVQNFTNLKESKPYEWTSSMTKLKKRVSLTSIFSFLIGISTTKLSKWLLSKSRTWSHTTNSVSNPKKENRFRLYSEWSHWSTIVPRISIVNSRSYLGFIFKMWCSLQRIEKLKKEKKF